MTKNDELEESISLEILPEWASYEKHYEELEKAQSRIGKSPLKTMQWITRLLTFNVEKLGDLSKGDFENLAYEIAVFSLLGTRRLLRIKAGKTILMDETWRGADWGDKRAFGESIPNSRDVRNVLLEVKNQVESILDNHETQISLHETKLVIQVTPRRGDLFTFYGRIQDKFLFHLAHLLADFGSRLQRCEDSEDCSRIFLLVRQKHQFCSTRCQSRIGTRRLRHPDAVLIDRAQGNSKVKRLSSDGKAVKTSKRGGNHGKIRG